MKATSSIVTQPTSIFTEYGLDPNPCSQPVRYATSVASLTIERYHWGNLYSSVRQMNGRECRWFVINGAPPIPKGLPSWCASIYVQWVQSKSKQAEIQQGDVLMMSATERARQRLKDRQKRKLGGKNKLLPVSHDMGMRFIRVLCNRLGKVLAKSQGASREGDMFIRDHYGTSKYITLLMRCDKDIKKIAQVWPLSRSEHINIQVYTMRSDIMGKMEHLGIEVLEWRDGRKSFAIKAVDDDSIPYAAKYISKQLEADNAL